MHLENTIVIHASPDRIFSLAAAVERWPEILPHYRRVTVLDLLPSGRLLDMAAWRGRIPVHWRAQQLIDHNNWRMTFKHIWGVTRGMEVEWCFEPVADISGPSTRVTIRHDLTLRWPLIGRWVAEHIIGPMFIDYIARRTLLRIKELAEVDGTYAAS
jgi:ribosome-associated toxin RatA of RatAB toxin-antitoxin module